MVLRQRRGHFRQRHEVLRSGEQFLPFASRSLADGQVRQSCLDDGDVAQTGDQSVDRFHVARLQTEADDAVTAQQFSNVANRALEHSPD